MGDYGIDIGGSLIKVVEKNSRKLELFESSKVNDLICFLQSKKIDTLYVTGGGAYKHKDKLESLGKVVMVEEFISIHMGINCSIRIQSPVLVVNIGTGVSIFRMTAHSYMRIAGSPIGGGTLLGLSRLLCNIDSFHEILDLVQKGGHELDLRVGDIYEGEFKCKALDDECIAGFFAKASRNKDDYKQSDILFSLLNMILSNIAEISYLSSKDYSISKIYFIGGVVVSSIVREILEVSLEYCSGEKCRAYFIEDLSNAIGALGAVNNVDSV